MLFATSSAVCPSLFCIFNWTSLYQIKGYIVQGVPAFTARCSAVLPSLSLIFMMDANFWTWQASLRRRKKTETIHQTEYQWPLIAAAWTRVLPWVSRSWVQSGHFRSKASMTRLLPSKAATCIGNDPSSSGWYAEDSSASNSSLAVLLVLGPLDAAKYPHDAAKCRGVLRFDRTPCLMSFLFHSSNFLVIPTFSIG